MIYIYTHTYIEVYYVVDDFCWYWLIRGITHDCLVWISCCNVHHHILIILRTFLLALNWKHCDENFCDSLPVDGIRVEVFSDGWYMSWGLFRRMILMLRSLSTDLRCRGLFRWIHKSCGSPMSSDLSLNRFESLGQTSITLLDISLHHLVHQLSFVECTYSSSDFVNWQTWYL